MRPHGRRSDHWRSSLDVIEELRGRMTPVGGMPDDAETRRLMAQVAHAKSSSFITLLDPEGRVLDVNPAALIAGGVDRSEVIGLPLWHTPWWSNSDQESAAMLARATEAAAVGRVTRFDAELAIDRTGRDGETVDLVLRPLRGMDGQVAFIVVEGRAITDRKRLERELARQNAELSALTERLARVHDYRERLLGELSHDLRAPLHVVVARADQALRAHTDPEIHSHIVGMRLAALDALEQVEDMLEQVKADHGETRLMLVDADLVDALRTVAEQFAPLASDREIDLRLDAPETVAARFDIERVSRIVSNLLANAIRHTPHGGIVRVSLSAGHDVAVLEVADSGPGIPAARRERVLERFQSGTAPDGRSRGVGAGLGLAIVQEFVELHGGELLLDEAPEGGALFKVALPLRPPEGSSAGATLAQLASAAQRTEYVRAHLEAELSAKAVLPSVPTVVIVERVPGRAEAIVTGIADAAVPCVADDAAEALQVAVELQPVAVVVGTATGTISPTSLLRQFAADHRLVSVRRVALAGEREEDPSQEDLLSAGAQLVIPAAAAEELGGRLWAAATTRP